MDPTPPPGPAPEAPPASDPTSDVSIQDYLEQQLFGGPIAQTAPEIASLGDQTALSASSGMAGLDYSFYTNPGASSDVGALPTTNSTGISGDMLSQMSPPINPDSYDYVDSTYDSPNPTLYDPTLSY